MTTHTSHTLQSSFEYDGTWWLAQDPDDPLPGKLTFSPENGARLDLIGGFRQVPITTRQAFRAEFIIGVTENNTECTLIDPFEMGFTPGAGKHTFMADRLLIGGAISSREQLMFTKCQISYDHFEAWITPTPFERELVTEDKRLVGHKVQLISKEAFRVTLALTDVVLSQSNRVSVNDQDPKKLEMMSEAFVKIEASVPKDLEVFQHWVSDLGCLFGIFMGDITWPRKVHLTPALSAAETGAKAPLTVSLFYRPVLASSNRRPRQYEMPVAFEEFVSRLPAIVDHWLSHDPRFQPVKDLFFYTLYAGDNSPTNRLLNLAHGLEAYHRYKMGGHYVDSDTYESFRKGIVSGLPSALPSDLRDALKGRIKYGNQYSFRKRLGILLHSLEPRLRNLVTTEAETFAEAVKATRNYNVHFDEEDRALAVTGADLLYLNQRLELLFRIFFMRELGFTDSEIHERLVDNGRLLPWNRRDEKYPRKD